jgi:transposase
MAPVSGDHLFGGELPACGRSTPLESLSIHSQPGRAATLYQRKKDDMARTQKSTSKPRAGQNRHAKLKPQDCTLGLEVVHPKAAGIDVGNEEHWVAVPPALDSEPIRKFGCYTRDLREMADWLVKVGIQTVAMQSTGVYWIALYDILAERGLRVFLVNARDTKNLPGRKTDIQECQWLLKLHVYGLLKNSFRPEEEILIMRAYWRQRQQHIGDASRCIQHMQKALTQMNVQLANAISDISGATGMAILTAILAGERDPKALARLRDPRIEASEAEVALSLEGNWRPELLFVLKQELESYQMFQSKIGECDRQLQQHYQTMECKGDPALLEEVPRNKRAKGNVPTGFDLREELYRTTGVDLTSIHGLNVLTVQTVLAEVGSDMSRFETEAHLVSFLGLSPKNKISGGKVVGRDKRKTKNRAGNALQQAAGTLLKSQTYLGAQYRRFRTKLGAPKAKKAMGNKLARIIYRMLKFGEDYVDKGQAIYEEKYRTQQIRFLSRKASELGMQLVQPA